MNIGDYVRDQENYVYLVKAIDWFQRPGGSRRQKALCKKVDGMTREPLNGRATRINLDKLTVI